MVCSLKKCGGSLFFREEEKDQRGSRCGDRVQVRGRRKREGGDYLLGLKGEAAKIGLEEGESRVFKLQVGSGRVGLLWKLK